MATQRWYLSGYLDNFGALTATPQSAATLTSGWIVGTGSTFSSEFNGWNTGDRLASSFVANTVPDGTFDVTWGDGFRSPLLNGTFASANWTFQFAVVSPVQGGAADGQIVFRLIKADYNGTTNASEITSAQQSASVCTNVASSPDSNGTLTFNPGAFTITNQYLFVQVAWKRTGAGGMTTTNIQLRTGVSATVGTTILTSDFTNATVLAPHRASTLTVNAPPTVVVVIPAQDVTNGTVASTLAVTAPPTLVVGPAQVTLATIAATVLTPPAVSGGSTTISSIAFDSAAANTSSATLAITIGSGADRYILIGLYTYDGSITSVTVDGVAATHLGGISPLQQADPKAKQWVYWLANPNSGTVTIAVTSTGLAGMAAACYTGVHPMAPEISAGHASAGGSLPTTATVAPWTDNDWAVSLANGFNASLTASTGVTQRAAGGNLVYVGDSNGPIHPPETPYSMTWNAGGNNCEQIVVAIRPKNGTPPDRAVSGVTISLTQLFPPWIFAGWTKVASTQAGLGPNGGTSPAIDTTGATLLVLHVPWYTGITTDVAVSDSYGNTWIPLTKANVLVATRIWYCVPPGAKVGPGHTFSAVNTSTYPSIQVTAWAGVDTASPLDSEAVSYIVGGASSGSVSLTPTASNCLVIANTAVTLLTIVTLDSASGLRVAEETAYNGTSHEGGVMAYLGQGPAATVTAVWTFGAGVQGGLTMAAFKRGAPAGPTTQAVTGATIASAAQLTAPGVARAGEIGGGTIASTAVLPVPHVYPSAPAAGGWHPVPLVQFAFGGFAGANGGVTSSFDSRFCNLLVAHVAYSVTSNFDPPPTVSDNQGNTWVQAALGSETTVIRSAIFYCPNPVTAATHTLTVIDGGSNNSYYPSVELTGWVGSEVDANVLDLAGVSSHSPSAATRSVGPIYPASPNTLIITGCAHGDNSAAALTIDASFTVQADWPWYSSSVGRGGAVASLVQSATASVTPTWSLTNATAVASTIVAFKTVPIRHGLLAYYAFDETSGNALDSLGVRHLTEVVPVAAATGKIAGARDFEADTFTRFQRTDAAFGFSSGDFTLAVWVNVESLTADRGITAYHLTSPDQPGDWQLKVASSGAVVFGHVPTGTTYTVTKSLGAVTAGAWSFVAVRYAGGTYTIWVDGFVSPVTPPSYDFTGAAIGFVVGHSASGKWFDGLVDEFAIWNTAKSDADVSWLYNSAIGRAYTDWPGVGAGAQTITGATLASSLALTAPTVAPGVVTLVGATLASTLGLFAPTLTPLTTGATIPSGSALFAPSVASTVTLGTRASTLALTAPTLVSPGPVAVTTGTIASSSQLFAPPTIVAQPVTVVLGTRSTTLALFALTLTALTTGATIPSGSVLFPPGTGSTQAITSGSIASGSTLTAPSLAPGPVTIVSGTRPTTLALFPPTLSAGTTGATIPSGSALFPPAVALTLTTGTRPSTLAQNAPTVAVGPVSVTTGTIVSTQVFPPMVAFPGVLNIGGVTLGVLGQLFPPSVTTGPVTVTLGTRASTAVLYPPTVAAQTGGATIPSGSQLYPPSVAQTVVSGTRPTAQQLFPPTIALPGVNGVGVGTIASTALLRPPTVQPGAATVLLPALGPGGVRYPPSVVAIGPPQTVVLGTIASTLALFPPSIVRLPPAPPCTAGEIVPDVLPARRQPFAWRRK